MWLEDKISFKIAISVQQIFVSQKFMELVVKSKKYSRQSLINNLLLIHHVISAMPTLLAILLDIFAITLLKKKNSDWQAPFEGRWELMSSEKSTSNPMQMLHKV